MVLTAGQAADTAIIARHDQTGETLGAVEGLRLHDGHAMGVQRWQAGHQYATRSAVSSHLMPVPQRRQFCPARP